MRADLYSTNFGSIIRVQPVSARGRQWWRDHVSADTAATDCDHRCGIDLLVGALADGLTVRDTTSGQARKGVPDGLSA
jgi:hypothetical protein